MNTYKILHIIQHLSRGGAARAMMAAAKHSSRLGNVQHLVMSLDPPESEAMAIATDAGMRIVVPRSKAEMWQEMETADIVHFHFWNHPKNYALLRSPLPPMRLLLWFHVAGDKPPQIITNEAIALADFALACSPYTYECAAFQNLPEAVKRQKTGMVYAPADFDRFSGFKRRSHDRFNVGYIGTIDFVKMHPNYVPMSAKIDIPGVRFIVCGGGIVEELQQQAAKLGAGDRFEFRGVVEDIKSVLETLDVYGYPLCEDTYAAAELNLQEVMYAGVPPVVFPYGGVKRLVINNETGLIVNSELEYKEAIEYLYYYPEERARLGRNAREYAIKTFGAENAARQLNLVYEKMMAMPKRKREGETQKSGVELFVKSLGDAAENFVVSMTSNNLNELWEADRKIALSSPLLSRGAGGILPYKESYPKDAYLSFWYGLFLQEAGENTKAGSQFQAAIALGFKHWRVNWYLAKLAAQLNKIEVAKEMVKEVIKKAPEFEEAKEMWQSLSTREEVVIVTSIAPGKTEIQQAAIKSWLDLGFSVVSLNNLAEINQLQPIYKNVVFYPVKRDAKAEVGRALVYLDDIFLYLKERGTKISGIVNSDIRLKAGDNFCSFINKQAENTAIICSRLDVDGEEDTSGEFYLKGFDAFFFDKKFVEIFPSSKLCLGLPWWDLWLPGIAIKKGWNLKYLTTPVAYHVKHEMNYDNDLWQTTGIHFTEFFQPELSRKFEGMWASNKERLQLELSKIGLDLIPTILEKSNRISYEESKAIKPQINKEQLALQRQFWNVNSLDEAMFGRVLAYEGIEKLSPEEKRKIWEKSIQTWVPQILRSIPAKPDWKLLEIGCGVGRLIKHFRESFAKVDGVDISANMIQFAKQYLADGKQNGEVYVNNGCDLQQLANESYDFVYSTIVFQHIRSLSIVKNYFSEIFRVLKPTGYFRIQVHDRSAESLGDFNEEGTSNKQYYFSGNAYTDEQLKELLIEAGFNLVSLECSQPWIWATVKKEISSRVNLPKVSAIVSTYNSEQFFRGCLEDLVKQTLYKKGELQIIIIDSASQQQEGAIASQFQTKYANIIYHRTAEKETIYAAWNRGIKLAKGEYITNANTDDRHRRDGLEILANYLDKNPETSLVYADQLITEIPNESWETTKANKRWNWPEFNYNELEKRCIIGPQPMWRKSLHEKRGYFREEFSVAGDYEFWLRVGKSEKIVRLPEILGLYYQNPQGLENNSSAASIETEKIREAYGIAARQVKPKLSIPTPISISEVDELTAKEKKSHILLYTDEPGIYGVGQSNHSILCELAKEGYQVSCVQSRASNYLVERQQQLGIQHFWLEYDTVKDFSRTLTDLADAENIFARAKPDAILFSDCCPVSNLAAKQVAIQLEIPFVVLVNFAAPYLAERFHSYLGKLSEIYARSQQTIAVSSENLHLLRQHFRLPKERGRVIHYGRPSQYFTPTNLTARDRLRQQLGIPANGIACFTSARLESVKGYQYQLQAIRLLKESSVWSRLYFVWAGSGSLESQLKTAVAQLGATDKVKFLGDRDDIPELLEAADIFVLPSEFEGMPLAIMEAMAKGVPVIASAVSGIPEELAGTGKLLPDPKIDSQATVRELAKAIQDWVMNPDLRQSIALASKQRAEQMFTEERMLTETLEVIKSALPQQQPLVSVIIPCYQQARFLPEAVASVVAQTYENWEIVIVNDGSPDATSEVARQIIQLFPQHKISSIEKENGGCASARNAGISKANGEYILPLDADDKLSSHAIACLVEIAATSKSHPCVVFGSYEIFGTEKRKIITVDEYSLENLKKSNMLVCTSLYSKSLFDLTQGYKVEIRDSGYEDWEFWLNCHRHHVPFYGIRETVLYYRRHPDSRVVRSFPNRDYYRSQVIGYYPDLFDAETIKKAAEVLKSNRPEKATSYDLESIAADVEKYQKQPKERVALDNLRRSRKQVADTWLGLATEALGDAYSGSLGQGHQILLNSGLKNELLTDEERTFIEAIKTYVAKGFNESQAIQYLLAGMLYRRADQLDINFERAPIPKWFATDYLNFLFDSPRVFQELGDADNYARYQEKWLVYIRDNIVSNPDSQLWQSIALLFAKIANFIPVYFASFNLKNIYSLRGDILEYAVKISGSQIDYVFPEAGEKRSKIRLGILNEHFNPQSETYSTIPAFEYLDRNKFEIILYAIRSNNHPLEEYCRSRSDRFVTLPNQIISQVETIRQDDLDILITGTNVTAIGKPVTLLMLHRLAPIQASLFSSPVTTGMRNIDYYISGELSETPDSPDSYREKLALLEGPGFCFNYYAVNSSPPVVKPQRSSWNANNETVIFISGANFYKIIPELGVTWAKILAKVPNSILVLYPFAPSWSNSYPGMAFMTRMQETFAEYGVEKKRLVAIKALPSRADVKECLQIADIYLDSYPYAGSNSLVDPLEMNLPAVVMDGEYMRSKQGAAMLRSLSIPDLIADSEESYINIAVQLATNPQWRQQKREEIQAKMQQNPPFLDSRGYSAKMGALLERLLAADFEADVADGLSAGEPNPLAGDEVDDGKTDILPVPEAEVQAALSSEFLNRVMGCVNLYEIDPDDEGLVGELRQLRLELAAFWMGAPPEQLESIYQGEMRQAYRALLASGFQSETLTEDEQGFLQHLTEVSSGLSQPKAVNALLGAMLYFPPGKMRVRDAASRLPQWLIGDYEEVFENPPQPSLEKGEEEVVPVELKFLNEVLGSVHLYYIDPSDESVVARLRQLRRQMADLCLQLPAEELEGFYQGEIGQGFQRLLGCGFQNEPMEEEEVAFLQEVAIALAKGIEAPQALNHLLAAMLYCRRGQLQVEDTSKLPQWLLEDYQKFASGESPLVVAG